MAIHVFAFWLMFAVLAPLLLVQSAWSRLRSPRLPPASGPVEGTAAGEDLPLRLLFVGESPVAGVGVAGMEESIAAQTARELAHRIGRSVYWRAAGVNGIRIGQASRQLLPNLPDERFDAVIAVFGVNDTTGLTPVTAWRQSLAGLSVRLRERHGGRVFFTQVAPMHRFTALPQPLRAVIGLRARILDLVLHEHITRGERFEAIDAEVPFERQYLAEDGYHPSAAGCAAWGRQIASFLHMHGIGSSESA